MARTESSTSVKCRSGMLAAEKAPAAGNEATEDGEIGGYDAEG